MARIGILTCSNCTQESNCASVVCLGDMRKRRGFFDRYPGDQSLDLIGIINCAGCPTLAAPEKILRKVGSLAEFRIDALHLSFCLTAVCPFVQKYVEVIKKAYPDLEIVMGTHQPVDKYDFKKGIKELLCQTLSPPQTMTDMIRGNLKIPQD
jgi:predicted metal-binding protein